MFHGTIKPHEHGITETRLILPSAAEDHLDTLDDLLDQLGGLIHERRSARTMDEFVILGSEIDRIRGSIKDAARKAAEAALSAA